MSDTQIPAGWYPDGATPGIVRWWDGTGWTEHTAPQAPAQPAVSEPAQPAAQPIGQAAPLAAGLPYGNEPTQRSGDTVFAYLLAGLWVVPTIVSVVLLPVTGYSGLVGSSASTRPGATLEAELRLFSDPVYLLSLLLGLVVTAAVILLAWLDARQQRRIGVPAPFAWPWIFFVFVGGAIGTGIVTIGRRVVLRRSGYRSLGPLVVWIAAVAVGLVAEIILVSQIVSTVIGAVTSSAGVGQA